MRSMSKYTMAFVVAAALIAGCTDSPERSLTAPGAAQANRFGGGWHHRVGVVNHGRRFAVSSAFGGAIMTPAVALTDDFSVSMRFELLGDNGCESDFAQSYDQVSFNGWDVAELGGACFGAENDHHLAFLLYPSSQILVSPLTVSTGGWHRLEAGRHAGHWFISLDGKAADVGTDVVGAISPENALTTVKAFDGVMDDLQFRNLATRATIAQFNFDEGSGSTAKGMNGSTLDLTGGGFVWVPTNVDHASGNGRGHTIDQCGTVISRPGNYVVLRDLVECAASGIVVNASNVTIQLKGHIIDSNGLPQPQNAFPSGGITVGEGVPGGVRNVSIVGPGEIREFFWGIALEGAERSSVSDVTLDDNQFGMPVNAGFGANEPDHFSTGNVVRNNTIKFNAGHGITMNGGNGNLFVNNDIGNNGGLGVLLFNGSADTVRNNAVIGNGLQGIRADNNSPASIGHVITGNISQSNSGGDLVDLWGDCVHNRWFGNTFGTKNPACIQ